MDTKPSPEHLPQHPWSESAAHIDPEGESADVRFGLIPGDRRYNRLGDHVRIDSLFKIHTRNRVAAEQVSFVVVRLDDAWSGEKDINAVTHEFAAERFGQTDQGMLARTMLADAWHAEPADKRSDIHDDWLPASFPARGQGGHGKTNHFGGGEKIDFHDLPKDRLGARRELAMGGDPRRVDEAVELAPGRERRRDHTFASRRIGQIGRYDYGLATGRFDRSGGFFEVGWGPADKRHPGAAGRQFDRYASADTTGRAGNEVNAIRKGAGHRWHGVSLRR